MTTITAARILPALKEACSRCKLRELCLPMGLSTSDLAKLERAIEDRRHVPAGEHLYAARDPFVSLYAVREGLFKTYEITDDGREHIHGFHMAGELFGLDAICTDHHTCSAEAIEDSEICVIPFRHLEELLHHIPTLMIHFHRLMSREIAADHHMMVVLGTMTADEKLAAFLLNLSDRLRLRGQSPTDIRLSMSREDIGNYLGLNLETVSRTFSRFQEDGVLQVNRRDLVLSDLSLLQRLAGCSAP